MYRFVALSVLAYGIASFWLTSLAVYRIIDAAGVVILGLVMLEVSRYKISRIRETGGMFWVPKRIAKARREADQIAESRRQERGK